VGEAAPDPAGETSSFTLATCRQADRFRVISAYSHFWMRAETRGTLMPSALSYDGLGTVCRNARAARLSIRSCRQISQNERAHSHP
jgi:hypothetical protein